MTKYGVFHYFDVSTAHVLPDTVDKLNRVACTNVLGITVAMYEYGWFISVPEAERDSEFTQDLAAIFKLARANDCHLVRLEADGLMHDTLDVYE